MGKKLTVVPGEAPSPLERLVDDYLGHCRGQGISRRTLNAYEFPLRRVLLPWARRAGVSRVEELDRRMLDRYAAELHVGNPVTGRLLSRDTVHSYLRPLRQLLKWAAAEGETVPATPKLPPLKRRLLEVLSLEEIDALEDAAATERDKLIIRVLADTGIRVGELVQLRGDAMARVPFKAFKPGDLRLLCIKGPLEGKRFVIARSPMVIGRDDGLDLTIPDGSVSRRHAEIVLGPEKAEVKDLGSRNGVFVNGARVASASIRPGDTLRVHKSLFVVEEIPPRPQPRKS